MKNTEIIKIDSQVKTFQREFKKEYSDIFFTKVIKATSALEMPEFPELPELPEGINTIKFDYDKYQKEGEKYLSEWSKKYEEKGRINIIC